MASGAAEGGAEARTFWAGPMTLTCANRVGSPRPGGVNSRQLNQKNNIHVTYAGAEGQTLLRLEMLSGFTVMGQATKCNEFEDRLRNFRVREQFVTSALAPTLLGEGISAELARLASLKADGILTEVEFAAAKARLLGI